MKKTLLIHIGWHKTATSFIQFYFHEYRHKLKEFNVYYPVMDIRPGHNEVKHSYLYLSIFNKLQIEHKQQNLEVLAFKELFELSLQEIAESRCRWTIISEEGLSEPHPGVSQLMGRYRNYFDEIKIIAYIRRQDYFLESLYAQFVKQKPIRSKLYLLDYIKDPEVLKRADYAITLDWWAEEFGKENILIAPFEKQIIIPDPLTYFIKLTGLPSEILDKYPIKKRKIHVTPPREITEFLRYLNLNNTGFFFETLNEFLIKSDAFLTNTKYFSSTDRKKIIQGYERSNTLVAKKYLTKDNGILFEEQIKELSNCIETWNGLDPLDVLDYALPVVGMMSHEIGQLRYDISRLKHKKSKKRRLKRIIYRFLQKCSKYITRIMRRS